MLSVTENELLKNVTTLPLSQTSKLTDVLKLSFNRQSDGSVFPDCFKNVSFFLMVCSNQHLSRIHILFLVAILVS